MPVSRARNLGHTTLRRTSRPGDPMRVFDELPAPVRHWLCQAALPWSPASAKRIWVKARASGLTPEDALARLAQAEAKTLARDKHAMTVAPHS
ncbi:MAG: DUF6525 family protein [Pseudomonadota bacterium]